MFACGLGLVCDNCAKTFAYLWAEIRIAYAIFDRRHTTYSLVIAKKKKRMFYANNEGFCLW